MVKNVPFKKYLNLKEKKKEKKAKPQPQAKLNI